MKRAYGYLLTLAIGSLFLWIVLQLVNATSWWDFLIKLIGWSGIGYFGSRIYGLHAKDRKAEAADQKARATKAAKLARKA